ncbi:hypothetical protein EV426DRAFT_577722 [Tirmania nivea]|nr:hypothetical protein EV426DRAFT_577722 [Tirmania nivea]
MPPSVNLLSAHHQLHPSREARRELNTSSSSALLYSTAHLSSGASTAASARDLKRHRSSTLEESPPQIDSKAATGRNSTSASKIPPTPGRKPSLLQKKPAAAQLYIKTSTPRTATSMSQARAPSTVPTTPTTLTSPKATSYSTLASPTSSPLRRKQPARFSSNGISTSAGPPPSLAYRKTNGMEQQRTYTPQTPTTTRTREISSTPITIRGGGGVQQPEKMEVDDDEKDQDRTIRGLEDLPRQSIDSRREEEDDDIAMADYDSNKDLFLSLAKAEPPRVGINASRRTQERQQQSRTAQRSSMPPPARPVSYSDASDVSPLSFPTNRKSAPVPMVDALAEAIEHGPRDASLRGLSSLKGESSTGIERIASPERESSSQRFGALNFNPTAKTLNPSPLQQGRTIASMLEQDKLERANSVAGDTASTVSTSAASVWDELEELKSRIHKLEVTGNTVGFGKGSDSSGGRPRTATTTATTLSSSPRNNNNVSGQSPSASMVGNSVHPLLHQALSRTRQLIDPEVYKVLEETAKDAFALVDIVGSNCTSGAITSPLSTGGGVDRQLRRKVDSLCRSLTELSLALSQAATNAHSQIPAAPPAPNQTPSGSFTSIDSYGSQRSHLSSLGRPMTREGGLESRLEERSATGLGLRNGRDSVLSDRKLLSRRLEIIDSPRRPSMQNLSAPSALQGLQQSVSYSDITRRAAPGSTAGLDAALKLERAKAQRAEAMNRGIPEPIGRDRDGQLDHIMQDLEMQESAYRTPSRVATDMLRASRRRAEERDREIEQLTNELSSSRRPSIYHNRNSSSATVTQSSLAATTTGQRNSPLNAMRSLDREREDGANISSMDRMARRSLLTRSMQEQPTQPLSPVDAGRRFFDERETRERERAQRNTIHVEGGYASVAAAAAGRREGGYNALELKRKSHSGAVTGTPGRVLRSAGGGGGGMDYEESGIEAAMEKERERLGTREGEGRRFLRRRVE